MLAGFVQLPLLPVSLYVQPKKFRLMYLIWDFQDTANNQN